MASARRWLDQKLSGRSQDQLELSPTRERRGDVEAATNGAQHHASPGRHRVARIDPNAAAHDHRRSTTRRISVDGIALLEVETSVPPPPQPPPPPEPPPPPTDVDPPSPWPPPVLFTPPPSPPAASATAVHARWARARLLKDTVVLCRRWHTDVKGCTRATWITCKATHTLLAGVLYRGALGFTRAQTVQVLLNSLALELVVLCMQFSAAPPTDATAFDPIFLLSSGLLAAAITIPGMALFALAFTPQLLANLPADLAALVRRCWRARRRLLRLLFCRPCDACRAMHKRGARREILSNARQRRTAQLRGGQSVRRVSSATTAAVVAPMGIAAASAAAVATRGGELSPAWVECSSASWASLAFCAPPHFTSSARTATRANSHLAPLRRTKTSVVDAFRRQLRRQQERQRPHRPEGAPRQFSYASLNTHLLRVSLSRALRDHEWRHAARIALGWALNLASFALLLVIFVVYSCTLAERHGGDATVGSLLESWWVSLVQRFALAEPLLIVFAVAVPMIFATECCTNLFSESFNSMLGVGLAMLVTVLKRLKRVS